MWLRGQQLLAAHHPVRDHHSATSALVATVLPGCVPVRPSPDRGAQSAHSAERALTLGTSFSNSVRGCLPLTQVVTLVGHSYRQRSPAASTRCESPHAIRRRDQRAFHEVET